MAKVMSAITGKPVEEMKKRDVSKAMDLMALLTTAVPGVGDVTGLLADAKEFITKPESRTKTNVLMALLGLAPFVPAMSQSRILGGMLSQKAPKSLKEWASIPTPTHRKQFPTDAGYVHKDDPMALIDPSADVSRPKKDLPQLTQRYQIPTHEINFNKEALRRLQELPSGNEVVTVQRATLGDMLMGGKATDNLFESYPHLYNLNVNPVINRGMNAGSFKPPTGTPGRIDITPQSDLATLRDTLFHEIQHSVQDYEGWPRGGNRDFIRAYFPHQISDTMKRINKAYEANPQLRLDFDELDLEDAAAKRLYMNLWGEIEARLAGGMSQRVPFANKPPAHWLEMLSAPNFNMPATIKQTATSPGWDPGRWMPKREKDILFFNP